MPGTAITLKFKICLFLDEASYWAEKLLTDINLPSLMPDEDNNFGGYLGLDFRKWWRHVQPKNTLLNTGSRNQLSIFSRLSLKVFADHW